MLATKAALRLKYDEALESALGSIENLLNGNYRLSRRAVGLLLLQGDSEMEGRVREQEDANYQSIQKIVSEAKASYSQPLSYIIALRQQQEVRRILETAVTSRERPRQGFAEWLSRAMMSPASGSLILLVVLYFGFYQFVGVLGAGTLVDFIEGTVFGEWINPWVTSPWDLPTLLP
jgi:ferrous iron transport protein B